MHVREHRRLDEIPFVTDAVASGQELGLLLLSAFDVAHYLVELVLIDLRSLFRILVEGVSHGAFLCSRHALLHEFVVALLLDEQSRTRATTLPLVEEQREM